MAVSWLYSVFVLINTTPNDDDWKARYAESLKIIEQERRSLAELKVRHDKLGRAYAAVKEELELLKRRIHVAKAERIDVSQLQLQFDELTKALDALVEQAAEPVAEVTPNASESPSDTPPGGGRPGPKNRPKGRRSVVDENHPPDVRIRIEDPALEGVAAVVGVETSYRIGYERGRMLRIAVDRVKYEVTAPGVNSTIVAAELPAECMSRGLLAPSMAAHLLVQKFGSAMPFYRQSKVLAAAGIFIDDGTMCRYAEQLGTALGGVVAAAASEARAQAFCLSTDATGACIQRTVEERQSGSGRKECRKGHFFVVMADQDHVFFEYTPRHNSEAVCEMFRGFSGYIQADANAVYHAVFRGQALADKDAEKPVEVACWAHARRGFWECAVTSKEDDSKAMLLRVARVFHEEAAWTKCPPEVRFRERKRVLTPLVNELFAWAKTREGVHANNPRLERAFGYLRRHEIALRRFFEDGRLKLSNNHSESELRKIAILRKNCLFFGSDDHAEAAANLLSLIASCKLHRLDPEKYLAELIHVQPQWPHKRQLELTPKYWRETRAKLDEKSLEYGIGYIVVPDASGTTA